MELYKVTLEYKNIPAYREWEKTLDQCNRALPPSTKRITCLAAVHPGWAGDSVGRACDLATQAVVGPSDSWDDWMPCILSVECRGSVIVEKAKP